MPGKLDFLAKTALFAELDEEELEELALAAEERDYARGAVVAYQRDVANEMYLVRSGRLLSIEVDEAGNVHHWRRYMPGDFIGDAWLFSSAPYPGTIKAGADSRVLVFKSEKFLAFAKQYPDALERIQFDEEARDAADHTSFLLPRRRYGSVSLLPDEIVKFDARRSYWLLVVRGLPPALGILLAPLGVYLLLNYLDGWVALGIWSYIFALLPALALTLWVLFVTLDWSNDWFVITNKHLIHYELDLRRFSTSISKIPVDQIQSVEVEKSNIWATLFNVGIARITTAAMSSAIIFDFIDNPAAVRDTITGMQKRLVGLDAGREQAAMRASIEGHFNLTPPFQAVAEEAEEEEDEEFEYEEEGPTLGERLWKIWDYFARGFRSRVEEANAITYRKHVFVLASQVKYPAGSILILLLLAYLLYYFSVSLSYILVLGVPLLVALGFFIWRLEDWRNDTFQLTDFYVVDIDRRPFGFGESRKQAELGNVQNVNANRPNLLATIFNFGDVQIETAGATADITFENVANPNQVQADVFQRRERYRQRQKLRARVQQREEYAVLLDVYHQANEQGRIPQRTPVIDVSRFHDAEGFGMPEEDYFETDRLADERDE